MRLDFFLPFLEGIETSIRHLRWWPYERREALDIWKVTFSGGYGREATPDPIPNSEVKLSSADGTAGATLWESRSPPDPYMEGGVGLTADTTLFCGPVAQLVRAHA